MSWPPTSVPPEAGALSGAEAEAVAEQVFVALADASRRAILAALAAGGPATATDLPPPPTQPGHDMTDHGFTTGPRRSA